MKMFASDNCSGVHQTIINALTLCNEEHDFPYGEDCYTNKLNNRFKEIFGECEVFLVTNGTGANVLGLSSLLRPYEAVICPDTAHINVDECGAFERFTGSKILPVPNKNGKIYKEDIEKLLHSLGNEHHSQPKVISISQVTEIGTVYSIEEIKDLSRFAHKHNMYLHMDGSRIANAAVSLNTTFKEMITQTGVDLLSFGGTKNGMMYGEAIISFNDECSNQLKYIRKQGMQLISKMRYISAQFLAYLENDLWKENAMHANKMAKLLAQGLADIKEVNIINNVDANMIFATIPKSWVEKLKEKYFFYVIDEEETLVRWITSFDTKEEEIDEFIKTIKELIKK